MKFSSMKVLPNGDKRPALHNYLLTFLAFSLLAISSYAQAQLQIKLALCLDGTSSMSTTEWGLEKTGTASGLHEALYPDYLGGEVEVSIIVFSTSATTVIGPTVINSQATLEAMTGTAGDTTPWTGTITALSQPTGMTNLKSCIDMASSVIGGTGDDGIERIIDLSTDGAANQPSGDCGTSIYESFDNAEECALMAADDAYANGIDVLNVLAVDLSSSDLNFLRVLTIPTPNHATTQGLLFTPPGSNPVAGNRGFVVDIDNFDEYQPAITAKIQAELQTTFTVYKDFSDNSTASVNVTLACSTGTITPSATLPASEASPAVFTVTDFERGATCTATEAATPGYSQSIEGCAAVGLEDPGSCTMFNTLEVSIPVNSTWALLILTLIMLATGWYFRPEQLR